MMHQRESSEVWLRTSSRVNVFAGGAIVGELENWSRRLDLGRQRRREKLKKTKTKKRQGSEVSERGGDSGKEWAQGRQS